MVYFKMQSGGGSRETKVPIDAENLPNLQAQRDLLNRDHVRAGALREILLQQAGEIVDRASERGLPFQMVINTATPAATRPGSEQQAHHDALHMTVLVQILRNRGWTASFGQPPPLCGHEWNVWITGAPPEGSGSGHDDDQK